MAPPSIKVGDEIRVQTAQANDYIFTDEWKDFGGFSKVIDTFENTDDERLLLPVNVYYHFYAGERKASLDALKEVYDWVLKEDLTPIWTSDYARAVVAIRDAVISRLGPSSYRVEQDGSIPSIRFDDCKKYPDLDSSEGVIGWCHRKGSLYLYLDGSEVQEFRLQDERPRGFALLEGNRPVSNLSKEGLNFSFDTWGPPTGIFEFQGLPENTSYWLHFESKAKRAVELTFRSDEEGRASFSVPLEGRSRVFVEVVDSSQYLLLNVQSLWWSKGRFVFLLLASAFLALFLLRRG